MIGDVGTSQRVWVSGQDSSHVERHVAVADDDHALMTQIDWQRGEFGVPVEPRNELGGGATARQAHALDVEPTIVGRADCVEHRVMVGQQFGVGDVIADFDVEVEPEAALSGDPVEEPGDALGGLVVRRDAGPHQPVRRRKLLEDVDAHPSLGEQFIGRVHRCGTGADDRHGQRSAGARVDLRGLQHRRQLRRRGQLALTFRVERRVQLDERQLLGFEPRVGRNGADRAGGHAGAAVDAGDGVDVEHLRRCEAGLVR